MALTFPVKCFVLEKNARVGVALIVHDVPPLDGLSVAQQGIVGNLYASFQDLCEENKKNKKCINRKDKISSKWRCGVDINKQMFVFRIDCPACSPDLPPTEKCWVGFRRESDVGGHWLSSSFTEFFLFYFNKIDFK